MKRKIGPAAVALATLIALTSVTGPSSAMGSTSVTNKRWSDSHLPGTPTPATPPGSASPSGADCQGFYVPVTPRAGSSEVYRMWVQLCSRQKLSADQPVQILVHGGTYNHRYWDWPFKPGKYSYVEAATKEGYATLNVDRLGSGFSDHPLSLSMDFRLAGHTIHQLVQYLRSGAFGPKFETVILNGHSMGGLTVQHEASAYNDVDALITTGVGHNVLGFQYFGPAFYPSELDAKFGLGEPGGLPGYLTSLPGRRVATFIEPGKYDPAIGPVEERHKDVLSAMELASITVDSFNPTITRDIEAPVLFALGQYDLFWCPITKDCNTDPEMKNEPTYYDEETSFTSYVVPNAGHSVNMNTVNHLFYEKTFDWLRSQGIGQE